MTLPIPSGNLRLICARIGDPGVEYNAENLPMVRHCYRCGTKVIATRTSLDQIALQGEFLIMCLPCHQADPGEKLIYNSHGQLVRHVRRRPETED